MGTHGSAASRSRMQCRAHLTPRSRERGPNPPGALLSWPKPALALTDARRTAGLPCCLLLSRARIGGWGSCGSVQFVAAGGSHQGFQRFYDLRLLCCDLGRTLAARIFHTAEARAARRGQPEPGSRSLSPGQADRAAGLEAGQ